MPMFDEDPRDWSTAPGRGLLAAVVPCLVVGVVMVLAWRFLT